MVFITDERRLSKSAVFNQNAYIPISTRVEVIRLYTVDPQDPYNRIELLYIEVLQMLIARNMIIVCIICNSYCTIMDCLIKAISRYYIAKLLSQPVDYTLPPGVKIESPLILEKNLRRPHSFDLTSGKTINFSF